MQNSSIQSSLPDIVVDSHAGYPKLIEVLKDLDSARQQESQIAWSRKVLPAFPYQHGCVIGERDACEPAHNARRSVPTRSNGF